MIETFTPEQEKAIIEKIGLLQKYPIKQLEELITNKRLSWVGKNRKDLEQIKSEEGLLGVHNLMRGLFEVYMKIHPYHYEMSIDYGEDGYIDFGFLRLDIKSRNFCPYLEACKRLDIPNELVCEAILEKPVQAVLDEIYPGKFRFSRSSYRPKHEDCSEEIRSSLSLDEYLGILKKLDHKRYETLVNFFELSETAPAGLPAESPRCRPGSDGTQILLPFQ